jgi:glucose/arabinose dehydrogenase
MAPTPNDAPSRRSGRFRRSRYRPVEWPFCPSAPSRNQPAATSTSRAHGIAHRVLLDGTRQRAPALRAELVATALEEPVDLQSSGDRSRLFVVERAGRIRLPARRRPSSHAVSRHQGPGAERGDARAGVARAAFHPRFAENGRFFVNYTSREGETHIAASSGGRGGQRRPGHRADGAAGRATLLEPLRGQLRFGPDGLLYIALAMADPPAILGNAQSLGSLLGKILRIDIDGTPYVDPEHESFRAEFHARREIWALGLRNPWRFAFDGSTGDSSSPTWPAQRR